ncbi:MAG TPA: hypothetical protein VFR95_10325 [Gemmatimonadaceae bacterium]|nr:hypothetical protein [Gemmatimonadaceae bacterium]
MPELPAAIRARVHGFLRGHDLDDDAVIAFENEALVLQTGSVRLALARRSLEGWEVAPDALHMHVDGGDVVSVATGDARAMALAMERWAFALPELTRSLRVFGSRRAAGGARHVEHDAFFAPLLAARGEAERAPTLQARRAALDARELRDAMQLRLRAFAAERYPNDAPERRALQAELEECTSSLQQCFSALEAAEKRLAACSDFERVVRWREWSRALAALFESADLCWPDLGATLAEDRRESPSRWRFLRRRATGSGL